MAAGVTQTDSWSDTQLDAGMKDNIAMPATIRSGYNLSKGQVVGKQPATDKYVDYDADGNASAGSAVAGSSNVGNGTVGTVSVQDDYTVSETVTLTCTAEALNGGTFSVTGSVTGSMGNATVGSLFRYPDSAAYQVSFTIADGAEDFDVGDTFTIALTESKALIAEGILSEAVDASSGDEVSSAYIEGSFYVSAITGLDTAAIEAMGGKKMTLAGSTDTEILFL